MSPATTRRILTRPTAGTNRNGIRPYWIVENNREMVPGRNAALHGHGLYTVTPAWRGSILYGTVGRFSVTNILFSAGWSEYWVDDPGFTAEIDIGPPNADEGPYRQARAVPQFGFPDPYNTDWYRLVNVTLQDGGEGYKSVPEVRIVYSPPPSPAHQFSIRAEIGAGGVTMDRPDHGLEVGDHISYRWLYHDPSVFEPAPSTIRAHYRSVVTAVSGASVHFEGGYPQPDMDPSAEGYYVPGDLCDGHTPDSRFGSGAVGPTWAPPGPYDSKRWNPYVNAPPYRLSIFRHDPEPVHFHQDKSGGPLRLGDLVAVHETVRINGTHRVCWPVDGLTRVPWWGQ